MSKTILNQELIKRIASNVLKGVSIASISALSGINPDSYYEWMKRGKADIENSVESVYRDFRESILAARAELELRLLDEVLDGDPVNAKWALSRMFRDSYGDKQEIEISGDIELVFVDDEDADMPLINTD